MFDLTMEDFDLLTDEEFEVLEQEVGRLTSCWKVSNTRGGSAIYWDDQRIGEKRHEYMALKHPSVNVEAEMAFRNKAVVDSLEGNSLIHPLTTPVIVVDKTNTKCRAVCVPSASRDCPNSVRSRRLSYLSEAYREPMYWRMASGSGCGEHGFVSPRTSITQAG